MNEKKHTYGSDPLRAPTIGDGDIIVYDEHGRDLDYTNGGPRLVVCYCSHWFRVVKHRFGGYSLLVKHGGGEESIPLTGRWEKLEGLEKLTTDERYLTLHMFHHIHREASRFARNAEAERWRRAIADKRIVRRKIRNQNGYKVGILPVVVEPQ